MSNHWPSKVLPQSMITIECMISKDFPLNNEHGTKEENGCSCFPLQKAWVFLDNIISWGNICEEDILEDCWHCKRNLDSARTKCPENMDPYVQVYAREISRVTVHELLHLCECTEDQIGTIDRALNPFWQCPLLEVIKE